MKGVLITGGTGYLGHGLAQRLLDLGHERVRVFSRSEVSQARMRDAITDERLGFFIGDVRDRERLERAMQDCWLVVHAAALKRIEVGHYNPDEMVKTNVLGAMNVIEAARCAGVERVILVSTDKAYEPVSPYGLSKAMAEHLFIGSNRMNLGPRFVVVRYGNVAGSTGSVIPTWRSRIAKGGEISITDPDCTRFWMRLDQAVDLVLDAFETPRDLLVPQLPAYRLGDLAAVMGATKVREIGLFPWEKKHESMDWGNSSDTARRLSVQELGIELCKVPA